MVTTHSLPLPNTNLSLFLCVHEIGFLIRPPPTFLDNVTEFPVFFIEGFSKAQVNFLPSWPGPELDNCHTNLTDMVQPQQQK